MSTNPTPDASSQNPAIVPLPSSDQESRDSGSSDKPKPARRRPKNAEPSENAQPSANGQQQIATGNGQSTRFMDNTHSAKLEREADHEWAAKIWRELMPFGESWCAPTQLHC